MMTMQDNAVAVFTHIPKTAGTTLHRIIRWQYLFRPGRVYSVADIPYLDRFKDLPAEEKRKINSIKGHLPFGIHEYCPFQVEYFTMLRQPQKRAISHYQYFRKVYKAYPKYKHIDIDKLSLADLLEQGILDEMDNCHVRYLCGVNDIPYGGVTEEHLQMAVHNLTAHYKVVGLSESFDESVLLFAKAFGWTTPYYVSGKVSRIKHDMPMDERTQELLKHYNRYDEVLYEAGVKLFNEQVANAGSGFKDEVATFADSNKRRKFLTLLVVHLVSKLKYFDKHHLKNLQILISEHLRTRNNK